jgi:hypothetical protein
MFEGLKEWICSPFKKRHPMYRKSFAVTAGAFLGEIIIFVKEEFGMYCFLTVPDTKNRKIPIEKFKFGIDNKIVEYVENIPANVYSVVIEQYKKNESNS